MVFRLQDKYAVPLYAAGFVNLRVLRDGEPWMTIQATEPRIDPEKYEEDRKKAEEVVAALNSKVEVF